MKRTTTVVKAAEEILEKIGHPMHYKDISIPLLEKGVLSGKTPHQTVCTRLAESAKFVRVSEGVYGLSKWQQYKPSRFAKDIAYEILKNYGQEMSLSKLSEEVFRERKFVGNPVHVIRRVVLADERFYLDQSTNLVQLAEWINI